MNCEWNEIAFARIISELPDRGLSSLIADQRRQAELGNLTQVVCYCQLLTAANHLANAYQELRSFGIIAEGVPVIPLRIFAR